MKEPSTATNGVMGLIEGLDHRVTRLESLSIKVVEQTAMQKGQFDALGKQITDAFSNVSDKMDVMSEHLTEKIDTVDGKVKGLEVGLNRNRARVEDLEDKQKVKESIFKFVKRYIFPIFTAAASLGVERLFFHHH